MDYLYGKLNFEVEKVDYTGVSSSTANIAIDKKEATIKVDVLKTPNHLMIDNLEDDSITYFDGSNEIIIELPKVSDRVLQSEFNNFKNYANEKFETIEEDYNQKIISESERATAAEATKVDIIAPYKYNLDTQQLTNTYVYTIVPNEKEPKLIKIVNTRSAEGLSIVQRANDGNICINETPKYDYHAASKKYVDGKVAENYEELNNRISQEINNILDGAPEQLNTLKEISDALSNNEELGSIVIQNQTNIANEIARAETVENQIISDLDSYKTSNNIVIEEFKSEYNSKISELEASDASNEQAIQDLENEYNAKVEELNNKNTSQDELITSNYNTLNNSITTEIERAKKAEEELSATITSNKTAHDNEYNTFKETIQDNFNVVEQSIQDEANRALNAEQNLSTALTSGLSALESTTNENLEKETTFDSGTLSSVAVGGVSKGTDLSKYSVKELLENILCPYVEFSLNVSSVTPNNSPYEKGTSVNLTKVNVAVTKGSKNITSLKLYESSDKTTQLGDEIKDVVTNNTFTINKTVTSSVSFYAEATDGTKTKGDSSSFLSFYDPTFYGVLNANYELSTENSSLITSQNKKLLANKNSISCAYTAKDQHPFFAYPASYGDLTSIVDSSNLDFTNDFNKTTINLNVKSGTVSYNIYVLKNVTEITNYTFIFK